MYRLNNKKGIKKIYYAFKDVDIRTANKLKKTLKKKNINIKKNTKEIQ